ncbi:hypothetical protein [Priestia megaterium]|uniref:hypothetical protein n=1 Tax=Priestia megaterium TaxID=1404 RepID=UPI00155FA6D4|nr:hypothetical protein [Priestia megaterium]
MSKKQGYRSRLKPAFLFIKQDVSNFKHICFIAHETLKEHHVHFLKPNVPQS